MEDAVKNKRPEQIKELREGLEEVVNEKGEIIDKAKFDKLSDTAEINRQAYDKSYVEKVEAPQVSDAAVASKKVFEKDIKDQEAIDTKTSRIDKMKTSEKKAEEPLNRKDKEIQSKEYENPEGDTTQGQVDAYSRSKQVLSYFARTLWSNKSKIAKVGDSTKLGHADRLAKYLAKEGKSFFEMTDADFSDFIKKNPSISQDSASRIIKGLSEIASLNRKQGFFMFNEKLRLIEKADIGDAVYTFVGDIRNESSRCSNRRRCCYLSF